MGELAGDKYSIQKRATRCILPRKRPRDRSRTLSSNLIIPQIQDFQRGIDLDVVGEQDGIRGLQVLAREVCLLLVGLDAAERLDLAVLLGRAHDVSSGLANVVPEQVDRVQGGAEKPNRKRDVLVSRLVGIGSRS